MKMNEGTGRGGGMTPHPCAEVVEILPLWVREPARAGFALEGIDRTVSSAGLAAHLEGCLACADEARFLQSLDEARPEPPPALAARIVARALSEEAVLGTDLPRRLDRVAASRFAFRRPAPGLRGWTSPAAAAAVLVLAVGIGLVSRGVSTPTEDGFLAYMEETADGWWGADWFVAGAPYLEGVSDETLAILAAEVRP
jgi:hypothetical protein